MEDMGIEQIDSSKYPALTRLMIFFAEKLGSLVDRIFQLSLFYAVMAMGILMTLPILGVWTVFLAAHFLPFPFGPIVVWGMAALLVMFAAAADHVQKG